MNKRMWYEIMIHGQEAVDAGYAFCKNSCTRGVYKAGKRIAQMEVVLDDEDYFHGLKNKWVYVGYIKNTKDLAKTLSCLARMGFEGCLATVGFSIDSKVVCAEDIYCATVI